MASCIYLIPKQLSSWRSQGMDCPYLGTINRRKRCPLSLFLWGLDWLIRKAICSFDSLESFRLKMEGMCWTLTLRSCAQWLCREIMSIATWWTGSSSRVVGRIPLHTVWVSKIQTHWLIDDRTWKSLVSMFWGHALEKGHYVWMNAADGKVYCIPDGYEVVDKSLEARDMPPIFFWWCQAWTHHDIDPTCPGH